MLAIIMNTADVIRRVTIKGIYKISQSTNANGQIISIGTTIVIIVARIVDNHHIAARIAAAVVFVMMLL